MARKKKYYKKILVEYLKAKNQIIKNATGIELFDERDYQEVMSWSDYMVRKIVRSIHSYIIDDILSDINSCPWCERYLINCSNCKYGERHGYCEDMQSNYQQITETLGKLYPKNNGGGPISIMKSITPLGKLIKEAFVKIYKEG